MNKTALITGASSGLGKEFALIHASKGRDLVLVARRKERLLNLKKEIIEKFNVNVFIHSIDLTEPDSAEKIFNNINNKGIEIDYLINNAGFGGYGEFISRDLNTELKMIDLNIKAVVSLTHIFLKEMIKKGAGKIMNVASSAGFIPGPFQSVYYATKSFIISFSEAIYEEIKSNNVSITILCPGYTETEFKDIASMDGTLATKISGASPEKVARYGYRAMEKGKLMAIYPRYLSFFINFLLPFAPLKLKIKVSRKLMEKSKIKKIK